MIAPTTGLLATECPTCDGVGVVKCQQMCPYCGALFPARQTLIPTHVLDESLGDVCTGSKQNPRNPESDGRPLWSGEPNPHFLIPNGECGDCRPTGWVIHEGIPAISIGSVLGEADYMRRDLHDFEDERATSEADGWNDALACLTEHINAQFREAL